MLVRFFVHELLSDCVQFMIKCLFVCVHMRLYVCLYVLVCVGVVCVCVHF